MDKKSVYIYSTAMCDAINVAGEITFKREKNTLQLRMTGLY